MILGSRPGGYGVNMEKGAKRGVRIDVTCTHCGKPLKIKPGYYRKSKSKKFFCNRQCSGLENYRRTVSEETRKKMSIAAMGEKNHQYTTGVTSDHPAPCPICGGKKAYNSKVCKKCNPNNHRAGCRIPLKTRELMGKMDKASCTDERMKEYREMRIKKGHWKTTDEFSLVVLYHKYSVWKFITSKIPAYQRDTKCLFRLKRVMKHHVYYKQTGFKNNVFPEILRHPCNCVLLSRDSHLQLHKDVPTQDDASLQKLFNDIENYKHEWVHQEECLMLIKRYRNEERLTDTELRNYSYKRRGS